MCETDISVSRGERAEAGEASFAEQQWAFTRRTIRRFVAGALSACFGIVRAGITPRLCDGFLRAVGLACAAVPGSSNILHSSARLNSPLARLTHNNVSLQMSYVMACTIRA